MADVTASKIEPSIDAVRCHGREILREQFTQNQLLSEVLRAYGRPARSRTTARKYDRSSDDEVSSIHGP